MGAPQRDHNLDDLRRLNLIDQDEPRNNATARNVYQPLVAGLERAGRTRTAPSAPSAAESARPLLALSSGVGRGLAQTRSRPRGGYARS